MLKKKWIIIGVIICIGILIYSEILHQIENRNNDAYVDYRCKDYHLVCLDMDKRVGRHQQKASDVECEFIYGTIKEVPDEEFIYAYKQYVLFGCGENLILQNPESDIDVLNDWTINKVVLYDYDLSDNLSTTNMKTAEDYVIQELGSSTEESLISQLEEIGLNDVQNAEDDGKTENYTEYKKLGNDKSKLMIRLCFEESEGIAWDAQVTIYQSQVDKTQYMVMIDVGYMDEDYERHSGDYIVDVDSLLYQFVVDAYSQPE